MIKNASPILNALRAATVDETAAVEFFEQHRWGTAPACPRCGAVEVYKMMAADGTTRNADYRWRCRGCKKMFSVRTGTPYEESRLPMRVWAYAFWKSASSKKGISALQLAREVEITHKSALFVLRRIRHGVGSQPDAPKMTGTVEADETYIGGKVRRAQRSKGAGRVPYSRGAADKAAVMGVVQRGGNVRFKLLDRVTADRLSEFIAENADLSCRLITDEHTGYKAVGNAFEGGHESVKHSAWEFAKPGTDIHSNTIEGVFSLIKRGVMGTFHSISRKHIPNYLNEFEFRWNTRKLDDGERVAKAIKQVDGKRLMYRESVDNPPYLVPEFTFIKQMPAPFDWRQRWPERKPE
jgi:transposase-like protein